MAIPEFQSFFRPVLAFASDGQEQSTKRAIEAVSDAMGISHEERQHLLPSGTQTTVANRIHWAITFLSKAGALRRTKRSHFVITDRGLALLNEYPIRIDNKALRKYPEFIEFQSPAKEEDIPTSAAEGAPNAVDELPTVTPEQAIEEAEETINSSVRSQLLNRIGEMSPAFFERLVVDLIVAMGYGGSRDSVARRVGKSGDEGIDGLVNEDPLGLDTVYIQAKRYNPDNSIGRERIQQFAGALVGQAASKGVFVTTSTFTSGAKEYAGKVPQRIVLVDGKELSRLMIQYGVGVRTERTVAIKRIDLDYFENED